jgi:hypothetical protein
MTDTEALDRLENPATGEVWFNTPISISTPAWAAGDEYLDQPDFTAWYELGTRDGKTIVGFEAEWLSDFFERDATGNYEWIEYPTAKDDTTVTSLSYDFGAIPHNTTIYYDSLTLPDAFILSTGEPLTIPEWDYGTLDIPGHTSQTPTENEVILQVGGFDVRRVQMPSEFTWSQAYSVSAPVGLTYTDLFYLLQTPYGMLIPLSYDAFGNLSDVSWTIPDTVAVDGELAFRVDLMDIGCGPRDSDHNTTVAGIPTSAWSAAGTSTRGETLYIPNNSNPLLDPMYQSYSQAKEGFGLVPVSLKAFLNGPGLIAYQAPDSGFLLVYLNEAYSGRAWC